MIRIDLRWLVSNVVSMQAVYSLEGNRNDDTEGQQMMAAAEALRRVLIEEIYIPYFKLSEENGFELLRSFEDAIGSFYDKSNDQPHIDVGKLKGQLQVYHTIFGSELAKVPAFLVSPKGAYDTEKLIDIGESLFPYEELKAGPELLDDMRQAARALAFDMPTACAFHTFRALEAVLRTYWQWASSEGDKSPSMPMGALLRQMEKDEVGSERVRAIMLQITRLHRNPVAHPEASVELEEAPILVSIASSAMRMMALEINQSEQTEIEGSENWRNHSDLPKPQAGGE